MRSNRIISSKAEPPQILEALRFAGVFFLFATSLFLYFVKQNQGELSGIIYGKYAISAKIKKFYLCCEPLKRAEFSVFGVFEVRTCGVSPSFFSLKQNKNSVK